MCGIISTFLKNLRIIVSNTIVHHSDPMSGMYICKLHVQTTKSKFEPITFGKRVTQSIPQK